MPRSRLDAESLIASCLRYGVMVGTGVIAVGVLLSPFKIGSYAGCPASLQEVCATNFGKPDASLGSIFGGLLSMDPLSIIELGALVLLIIPFFRVAIGAIMYAARGNWTYVAISAFVVTVLLISTLMVAPWEAWG